MRSLYLIFLLIGNALFKPGVKKMYTDAETRKALEKVGIEIKSNKSLARSPVSYINILVKFRVRSNCDIVLIEKTQDHEGSNLDQLTISVNKCIHNYLKNCQSLGSRQNDKIFLYNCHSGIFALRRI